MKPWEVWNWRFPDAGEHPAVLLGTAERVSLKPRVCVLLCKCDVVYAAPKSELVKRRGTVTPERRRAIAERVIRALGLAGL